MIAGDLALSRRVPLSRWQIGRALLVGGVFAAAFAVILAFPSIREPLPLVAGEVSPNTILSPERITYASELETRDARAKAEAEVQDVYDPPNAELAREQVRTASRVFDFVDSVRHDPYTSPGQKVDWVQSIPTLTLPVLTISRTVSLDETDYHRVVTETLYVLDVTMRDQIRPTDLQAEYGKIPSRVSLALSADQADLVAQWSQAFVVPNSNFNFQKTTDQRAQARERVGTVYRTVEKGEAVVREGEVVAPQAIESLQALGLLHSEPTLEDYVGPALFALLMAIVLAAYLARLRPALYANSRGLLLIAFVLLLFTLGARLSVADRAVLVYLYPMSAAIMLLAVLVDSVVAVGAALVLALTMGFLANASLAIATYTLVGGAIAAISLGRIERLPALIWSGVYIALGNMAVISIFRAVAHDTDPTSWGQQLLAGLGNGALAGLIAIGSLFVLGKLFGITTSIELIDLARPTHPLLQKLLSDAPGTYHHSLVVGQLAEHAAQRIGADALLVRVGAYYHDVGKTRAPQMYVENQFDGMNIHDSLEPKASATIVIDHVQRGLTLARAHSLPRRLRDFIPQHHGTTLTAYFHHKAVHENGDAPIDEKDFRYPGPKPQTREAGVLMLADGVEATTRAERPATPEAIRGIVDRVVGERLRDGQLDECDLTLRDLQQVKDAFFEVLQGLYHSRVRYPEPTRSPENGSH